MFMSVCLNVCICTTVFLELKVRRERWIFWSGYKEGCEPSCGWRESNPCPLQEQQVVLNHWVISPALILLFKLCSGQTWLNTHTQKFYGLHGVSRVTPSSWCPSGFLERCIGRVAEDAGGEFSWHLLPIVLQVSRAKPHPLEHLSLQPLPLLEGLAVL